MKAGEWQPPATTSLRAAFLYPHLGEDEVHSGPFSSVWLKSISAAVSVRKLYESKEFRISPTLNT